MGAFAYSASSLEAIEANRVPLLAALAALEISFVTINYEGGGDSGDVTEVFVKPEDKLPLLATEQVMYYNVLSEYRDGNYQYQLSESSMSIDDALHDFTLTWLEAHHGGWENNEGGDGMVTIVVPESRFHLAHSECYVERTDYDHTL